MEGTIRIGNDTMFVSIKKIRQRGRGRQKLSSAAFDLFIWVELEEMKRFKERTYSTPQP